MLWWWWLWLVFVVLLLVVPLGYGWGIRGWGPPYPSYWRRRAAAGGPPVPSQGMAQTPPVADGWGVGADLLWIVLLFAVLWFVVAIVWW